MPAQSVGDPRRIAPARPRSALDTSSTLLSTTAASGTRLAPRATAWATRSVLPVSE